MESMSTRKREHSKHAESSLKLYEQLVVLLRTRSEVRFLCNRVSLSLRACIVVELALCGAIGLKEGRVVGKDNALDSSLLLEAMNKIYQVQLPPDELMYRLNGEKRGGSIYMRNVRLRVYKGLEEKRICKVENSRLIFNKITMNNYNVRIELINYMKEYLTSSKEVDYRAEALAVCLIFCSAIDSILICMTEKEAVASNAHINRIKEKYMSRSACESGKEMIIHSVLKALLNS
ncbi:golgi phosphoprotein 3 [Encephalitozoon hellem]|nr:golgi phosphoprotein 3 [Encephalitozoon hellem]